LKQHQENAIKVAAFLENHSKIKRVYYPGLMSHPQYELGKKQMTGYSGLMSFVPKGDIQDIMRFVKALKYFEEGPSWGGFESLINTPGVGMDEETSKQVGIPQGLVRISVGLENIDTLIQDLEQALDLL
jgi:cystathionine beta-lyase/cystathionine gamma-synthase